LHHIRRGVERLADAGDNLKDRIDAMERMPRATTAVLAVASDSGRTLSLKEIFNCSPEAAFRALTDIEHVAEIYGQGTMIEPVTAGPMGVGTKFHKSREVGGRSLSELVEITEYDPPHRVTFVGQSPQARTVRQVSIAGNALRSTVAVLLSAEPTGVAGRLIPAAFAPKMKALGRSLAQELVDVRRFVERAPTRRLLTDARPPAQEDALWALTNGGELSDEDYDDLTKIRGIGPVMAKKLRQIGVSSYRQLAAFTAEDIERIESQIVIKGRITRDRWVEQARALAGTIA
jgi:predicted flap endonuclease-1-like 5' DNA nuclease